ncbi:hypothetical protein LguiB_016205 [Lonicera macranthoides]
MIEQKKRQPVFCKVEQLRLGGNGLNLTVKVVSSKMIMQGGRADGTQGRQICLVECLVGDETGMIIFTAKNNRVLLSVFVIVFKQELLLHIKGSLKMFQVFSLSFGLDERGCRATVILRNSKIDIFKGSMRLAVDKWGHVEVDEPASFSVKEDSNLSLIEFELVNVVEE